MSDSELANNASPSTSPHKLDVLQSQPVDKTDAEVTNTKLGSENDVTTNVNGDADMEDDGTVQNNAGTPSKENEEEEKEMEVDKVSYEVDGIRVDEKNIDTDLHEPCVLGSSNNDQISPENSDLDRQVPQEKQDEDNNQGEIEDADGNKNMSEIVADDKNGGTENAENKAQNDNVGGLDQDISDPSDDKGENEDDLLKEREEEQIQDNTQEEEEMDEDKLLDDADNIDNNDVAEKPALDEENDEIIASEPASDLCEDQDSSKHADDSDARDLADTESDLDNQKNNADTDQVTENVQESETSQKETEDTEEKDLDIQDSDNIKQSNDENTPETEENEADSVVPSENSEKVSCDVAQTEDTMETTNEDIEMKESNDVEDVVKEGDSGSEKGTDDIEMTEERTEKVQEDIEIKEDQPVVITRTEDEGEPVSSTDDKKSMSDGENESQKDEEMIQSPDQTDTKEDNSNNDEKSVKVSDDEIDESDIKIIDIKGVDEEKKDDIEEISGDPEGVEDNDILNNEDSGEMCLQIASVSGGTDIPDVLKQEEENQKTLEPDLAEKPAEEKAKPVVVPEGEVKQEVKAEPKPPSSTTKPSQKVQTCIVCNKTGKCKYNIVRNGDIKHLCDDACFKMFRSCPTAYLRSPDSASSAPAAPEVKKPSIQQPVAAPPEQYKTCSVCQLMNIKTSKPFLNWQGMDFCGEDCLGKFQGNLNASCSNCGSMVKAVSKGKYCLRFANEVKQFCSGPCYSEFKKRQKLCECCQKDISKSQDAFVAPVGKEGTFKDFCSQTCLQKYEDKTNSDVEIIGVEKALKSKVLPKGNFSCAVCGKNASVKHEIKLEGKMNRLCSDPCFSAFQYANKLTMNTCDNCGVYCYNEGMTPQYIQFEGQQKRFCSYICVNQFKSANKKIVNCAWCSCKKSNFDMIERVDANNKYQLFCSLNCLSLYRVNLQATSNQAVMCDECKKFVPAQYHLTMSDASVRNFCSYQCVMSFQFQFSGGKQTPQQPQSNAQPQGQRSVSTRASARVPAKQQGQGTNQAGMPVISNVVSLAQQGNQQINLKNNANVPVVVNTTSQNTKSSATQQTSQQPMVKQQIIIQPPPPKVLKNKSLLCKPFVQTKATSCRPHTQTKETQTECDWEPKKYFIPVPVPVYVPTPMAMYSQPTPVPLPIPIPIPIPCFIPTTKKSAEGILKQIKEIQEKIPNDPLEAELLMMAEAVAGGEEDSDSDTEIEAEPVLPAEPVKKPTTRSSVPPASPPPLMTQSAGTDPPPAPQNGNEFGEDMLQMALRMASEMTEPVMDLESSIDPVPVSTEPPIPKPEDDEEEEEVYKVRETRSRRGTVKRARGGGNNRRSKRQRTSQSQVDTSMDDSMASEQSVEQEPAPDANMYLKFTYGINAWKHWVVHKNAQLEKVSKHGSGKLKLFKTDMLGCSADELNYSLCLFVKEVRKPNGEEYAPDSIFYLCLGIQQYLFENGRIDNIFTDMYYEKYTECLNEVLQRYEPKLNTAGQLVCRIEEEHLWESKQLGAHSPHVLLNTLVYFNTKYFMLKNAEDHMKLSFTHIMKHWKKIPPGRGNSSGRSVYLRYYCPMPTKPPNDPNLKKKKEELPVYEQAENIDNPLRCPVKLYEFYLSKCPESIKNRNDAFYLVPERSCVPDSPVWYSTQNLSIEAMNKMLNRLRLVREIQEAMLHTQPVYVS